jgi:serine/threonine protein kinase
MHLQNVLAMPEEGDSATEGVASTQAEVVPLLGQMAPGRVMNNRYTILRPLGKGGMGAVYLASETIANTKRQVVIKEMLEYYDPDDPEGEAKARQRFETEASTLVSLNLAGIPQIFDFFSESGRNYIVMQFLEGQNLEIGLTHLNDDAEIVAGEAYPLERVRQWGIQVCKVLENLAVQNIVHMDIKPPNLILDKSGDVWLVDFGTAKAQWAVEATGKLGVQKSSIYGTIGFAPPEQYSGKAEPRSDVYALASTLYHLATDDDPRRHPFTFPKVDQLPEDFSDPLKRALEKDVTKRITAAELRKMLSARLTGPATGPTFRWQDGTVSVEPRQLVEPANCNWQEALDYFQGEEWENWFRDLHRNDILSALDEIKSKNTQPASGLDEFLRFLDPGLPRPRLIVENQALDAGTLRRDERKTIPLKLANQGGGWLTGRFTGLPAWVHIEPPEFGFHTEQTVLVSVNPRRLSPASQPYVTPLTIGWSGPAEAAQAERLDLPLQLTVRKPRWVNSLGGRLILTLLALVILFSGLAFIDLNWVGWAAIRADPLTQGTLRYGILFTSTRDGKQDIYRITHSGTTRITRTPAQGESWAPVPDLHGGVLFTSNRDGKREIYRLTTDGTQRLTNSPGEAESWSAVPELGGSILFTSNRDGKREIYRLSKAGEISRVTTTPDPAESWGAVPVWNGDILFTSNRDGKSEIYRMDKNDMVVRLTETPGDAESLAPVVELNGNILFTSNRDGHWEIYRLTRAGDIERITETSGSAGSWFAVPELGGNLLFSSDRDGKIELYRSIAGRIEKVTTTSGQGESYFAQAMDDFLFGWVDFSPQVVLIR